MRARRKKLQCFCAALLLGGCAYALLCSAVGFGIPCLFRLVTGWKCPGCGVSRMALSLLRLDFSGAWRANAMLLSLLPVFSALALAFAVRYVRVGTLRPTRLMNAIIWLLIAALLLFGLLRNLC